MLFSMALTSFLTGVTEPIEFSFMFLAPVLYAVHAVLTGVAMVLMHALDVHLGFGFSAGLFDYLLNFPLSTRPLLLIPVGLAYFGLYFVLFRWFIVRFDLRTPGREAEDDASPVASAAAGADVPAMAWIQALGTASNLRSVEACTTRLRLVLADPARIDEKALKALGSRGVLRLAEGAVQVVVGPIADQLASDIRAGLRAGDSDSHALARAVEALGGRGNIAALHLSSSRLCISLREPAAVDEAELAGVVRAVARPAPGSIHLVVGPAAAGWFAELKPS
jgi:PTS system N-acetylglucosamine-specific IIC component